MDEEGNDHPQRTCALCRRKPGRHDMPNGDVLCDGCMALGTAALLALEAGIPAEDIQAALDEAAAAGRAQAAN